MSDYEFAPYMNGYKKEYMYVKYLNLPARFLETFRAEAFEDLILRVWHDGGEGTEGAADQVRNVRLFYLLLLNLPHNTGEHVRRENALENAHWNIAFAVSTETGEF